MKTYLLLASLLIGICSCGEKPAKYRKPVYHEYRYLFYDYTDSFRKYLFVNTECGQRLSDYYKAKADSAYLAMYPKGNPCCDNEEKKQEVPIDTTCYTPKW